MFNEDAIATLAKWGFGPGAAFGDTMHFDFIEGYTNTVKGGRSWENMNKDRFSPEGDLKKPVDPKTAPTVVDPKATPKVVDPKGVDPKAVDPKAVDPNVVPPKKP